MRAVGYVRVSTDDQRSAMQRFDVERYAQVRGWTLGRVYEDQGLSGATARRPGLTRLLEDAHRHAFDALIVWKLDRLGRSVRDLLTTLETLRTLGIEFCSATEAIDTSTAAGRMVYALLGVFAEFERERIGERVRAGIRAKLRAGGRWGRPATVTGRRLERARELRGAGTALRTIARELAVPRTTLRRALELARENTA